MCWIMNLYVLQTLLESHVGPQLNRNRTWEIKSSYFDGDYKSISYSFFHALFVALKFEQQNTKVFL